MKRHSRYGGFCHSVPVKCGQTAKRQETPASGRPMPTWNFPQYSVIVKAYTKGEARVLLLKELQAMSFRPVRVLPAGVIAERISP